MIPAQFDYEVAESVEHAVDLLGELGDEAKILAGGQSLLPLMKLRFARPTALVDIGRLAELSYVREHDGAIAIGAMTRYADAHRNDLLRRECPLLAHAAGEVGDPQVRNVGTVGGGVAHGDPAGDVPAVLVALGGDVVAVGPGGERVIPAGEFFHAPFQTALRPTEVLTEIRVPRTGDAGWAYKKFQARAQDWAIVAAAVVTRRSNGGVDASVALANKGPAPLKAAAVEAALRSGASPADACESAAEGSEPVSDPFASSEYRRALAPIVVRRAVEEALGR